MKEKNVYPFPEFIKPPSQQTNKYLGQFVWTKKNII